MSYLERLIERATNTNLDLENNTIGSYRIAPQHGQGLAVYHIYKNERHSATISIYDNQVNIEVNNIYLNPKEISDIIDTINNIYSTFNTTTVNF
jgi:hypothetical protein